MVRGFIPDGQRSGPNTAIAKCLTWRVQLFYDCFAADRG